MGSSHGDSHAGLSQIHLTYALHYATLSRPHLSVISWPISLNLASAISG